LYRVSLQPPPGSPYRRGYWSTGGFTADSSGASLISVSDEAPPSVGTPTAVIQLGASLGSSTVPVQVRWTASDPGSNVMADRLQQQSGNGAWTTVSTSVTRAANRLLTPSTTTTYRFRARATDYAGNTSADRTGPAFRVIRTQQTSASVSWAGSWTTRTDGSPSGGSYRRTTAAGASARFAFTGRAVAWVASTGPAYGKARVYVDGAYRGTIDLHAAATTWRRVVFSTAWTSSGSHSIRIVGEGTAGHPSVTVDAFAVLR